MTVRSHVVCSVAELASARADWTALLERSATNVPTLSPLWLLRWWETFGSLDGRELRALLFFEQQRLVGLAPLLARPIRSRIGRPFRRIELLGAGEREGDELCCDYVGVIAERGKEQSVADAMAEAFLRKELGAWDELSLSAMAGDSSLPILLAAALRKRSMVATAEVVGVAHYIPLPLSWEEYLASLSTSRRHFLRRALKAFDGWAGGTSSLERATTREEVERALPLLARLHDERWPDGHSGAISSSAFQEFNANLMGELLQEGAIELVWLVAHGEPIAAAYNLIWDRRLYFYQGGRSLRVPGGIRPGVALHAQMIRAAIDSGYREYDFLPGNARYEADLGLETRPIVRVRGARPSFAEAAREGTNFALTRMSALRAMRSAERSEKAEALIARAHR